MKAKKFWTLSLTWGLLMTLFGILGAIGMLVTGHKPKRFHYLIYFEIGEGWGGVNFGPIFFVSKGASLSTKQHEAGHGIQNTMLGPLQPFVVAIPSAARYWYRDWVWNHDPDKYRALPDYDAIWFEGQATALGEKHFKTEG